VANRGSDNVSGLLGLGDGTFQSAVNYDAGKEPYSVAIGDFDKDGNPDLAVANNDSDNVSRGIFLGLSWSMGFGVIVFSIWGIFLFFRINLLRFLISPSAHLSSVHFLWLLLIGGIFAPVIEDSFFVGCLYNSLRQKISPVFSALGTSFFFALLHGLKGPPVTQFIGGLIFAFAFEYSANLLTPIIIHVLGNGTLFTLNYSSLVKAFFLKW